MGVSFHYRRTSKADPRVPGGFSSDQSALERAFGPAPWRLSEKQLPVLRGMASMSPEEENFYAALIEIIEKHGEIEVWAEY